MEAGINLFWDVLEKSAITFKVRQAMTTEACEPITTGI